MTPDQRAIVDTAMLDESFGDMESRKMLQSLRAGATKKYRAKQLEITGRGQTQRYELGKEEIGLSKERFESQMRSSRALQDLRREKFEFGKKQLPIATGLNIAGIGLGGYIGYQDMKRKQKMAQDYMALAKRLGGY